MKTIIILKTIDDHDDEKNRKERKRKGYFFRSHSSLYNRKKQEGCYDSSGRGKKRLPTVCYKRGSRGFVGLRGTAFQAIPPKNLSYRLLERLQVVRHRHTTTNVRIRGRLLSIFTCVSVAACQPIQPDAPRLASPLPNTPPPGSPRHF